MSTEMLLWGLLPMLVAVTVILLSADVALRWRRPSQVASSLFIILLCVGSLSMMGGIFGRRGASYLPHLLIGAAVLLSIWQRSVFQRNCPNAD